MVDRIFFWEKLAKNHLCMTVHNLSHNKVNYIVRNSCLSMRLLKYLDLSFNGAFSKRISALRKLEIFNVSCKLMLVKDGIGSVVADFVLGRERKGVED